MTADLESFLQRYRAILESSANDHQLDFLTRYDELMTGLSAFE